MRDMIIIAYSVFVCCIYNVCRHLWRFPFVKTERSQRTGSYRSKWKCKAVRVIAHAILASSLHDIHARADVNNMADLATQICNIPPTIFVDFLSSEEGDTLFMNAAEDEFVFLSVICIFFLGQISKNCALFITIHHLKMLFCLFAIPHTSNYDTLMIWAGCHDPGFLWFHAPWRVDLQLKVFFRDTSLPKRCTLPPIIEPARLYVHSSEDF